MRELSESLKVIIGILIIIELILMVVMLWSENYMFFYRLIASIFVLIFILVIVWRYII
jgi:hypothetical protein